MTPHTMHHDPLGSIQASLPIPSGVRVMLDAYPGAAVVTDKGALQSVYVCFLGGLIADRSSSPLLFLHLFL